MKRVLLWTLVLSIGILEKTYTQIGSLGPTSLVEGDTYALIIGISDYQDDQIRDLKFAHRDATIFAEYLQSASGGNVPAENIKLLTNSQATISNVYLAKQWLEDKAKKGDLIYFYFSGHGDVESSLYKLGFLLAYDTPHKNYLNNAIRIEDFNIMANTLSIQKEAEVVLITDACHSGKLAGSDNRGGQLVGEQLQTVLSKEIRIASCEADQLSQEDEVWGGGRGAFSYHLINGLTGLADDPDDPDGIVTKMELEDYLSKKVMKDVMKFKNEEQTPVIAGKPFTKLALVDDTRLNELRAASNTVTTAQVGSGSTRSADIASTGSPLDMLFGRINNIVREEDIAQLHWPSLSKDQLILWIKSLPAMQEDSLFAVASKAEEKVWEQKIAAWLHDQVQVAINAYLVGDKDELNNRQYYNAQPELFERYAYMLEVAQTMVPAQNYLSSMMKAKSLYFKGIAARMTFTVKPDNGQLLIDAMQFQNQALAIDDRAPYVHNEIGVLHKINGKIPEAEASYKKAIELSPKWSLPHSNLSNIYVGLNRHQEGLAYGHKAIELQPDYYLGHVNLARNSMALNDYLTAEEALLKAIDLNNYHYISFEIMAYLYTDLCQFDLANYYFNESEKRKAGFPIFNHPMVDDIPDFDADGISDVLDVSPLMPCVLDPNKIKEDDVSGLFVYGFIEFTEGRYQEAEKFLLRTIKLDEEHPLAYKYLAEIVLQDANFIRGQHYSGLALENYLGWEELEAYLSEHPILLKSNDCDLTTMFMAAAYDEPYIHFLHAYFDQKLSKYEDAIRIYEGLIEDGESELLPYQHLWLLYERLGRYQEAEYTIYQSRSVDPLEWRPNLLAFYDRRIEEDFQPIDYGYKAGLLCFDVIPTEAFEGEHVDIYNLVPPRINRGISPKGINLFDIYTKGDDEFVVFEQDPQCYPCESERYLRDIKDRIDIGRKGVVYYKLGDIYKHLYRQRAESDFYYEEAVNLLADYASIRTELIDNYLDVDRLTSAYTHLKALFDRHQITHDQNEIFAEFSTMKGDYDHANKSISLFRTTESLPHLEIEQTATLLLMLEQQYGKAADSFAKLAIMDPEDQPNYLYGEARAYALKGDYKKAMQKLKSALDKDFDNAWVLFYDPAFETLRTEKDFIKQTERLVPEIIGE